MKPEGKATLAKAGQRKDATEAISKAAKRAREERDGAAEASIKAANAAWECPRDCPENAQGRNGLTP